MMGEFPSRKSKKALKQAVQSYQKLDRTGSTDQASFLHCANIGKH